MSDSKSPIIPKYTVGNFLIQQQQQQQQHTQCSPTSGSEEGRMNFYIPGCQPAPEYDFLNLQRKPLLFVRSMSRLGIALNASRMALERLDIYEAWVCGHCSRAACFLQMPLQY